MEYFTKYTYHSQTNLLYIVNVLKIRFKRNRKMTADVWRFLEMTSGGYRNKAMGGAVILEGRHISEA